MQTTTIRTAEPRELLSLIPYQLGFQPEQSAVVVSLRGPRSRVGLVARVDLVDLAHPGNGPQIARSLVSHLVADGARRIILVLYPGDDPSATRRGGDGSLAHENLAEAAEHFFGPVECWVVTTHGYYGLDCSDATCCPPGGRPLSDLMGTEIGAQMVLNGASVLGSRRDLGRITPAPAEARRSARRAAARWTARGAAAVDGSALIRWRAECLSLWRAELVRACAAHGGPDTASSTASGGVVPGPWLPPSSALLGRLQAGLADVLVRDAVMLSFVPGTDRVGDRVVAGEDGPDVGRALRAIIDPVDGTEPDAVRVAAARAILEQVAAHSAKHAQAPALTLLAVLAWWEGDGARAGVLVDRAVDVTPGYRLAMLIGETLDAGMPPGWLRRTDGAAGDPVASQ